MMLDKLLKILSAAGHGVVIQNVTPAARIALAILLVGITATVNHYAPGLVTDSRADALYAVIVSVFGVSVVGTPKDDGKLPGINPSLPPDPLDRIK